MSTAYKQGGLIIFVKFRCPMFDVPSAPLCFWFPTQNTYKGSMRLVVESITNESIHEISVPHNQAHTVTQTITNINQVTRSLTQFYLKQSASPSSDSHSIRLLVSVAPFKKRTAEANWSTLEAKTLEPTSSCDSLSVQSCPNRTVCDKWGMSQSAPPVSSLPC